MADMRLYVANLTMQNHMFAYRITEQPKKLEQIPIPPGGQVLVREADIDVIDEIIGQHTGYGMVAARALDRQKVFIGLAFSIDKPVDIRAIQRANAANMEAAFAAAARDRQTAAAAAAHQAATLARAHGHEVPRSVSVEVEEIPADPRDKPALAEVIEVPISAAPTRRTRR